jgi:hypothetical protein
VAVDDWTSLRWSTDGVRWEGTPVSVDPWRLTRAGDDVIVHGRDGAARYSWNGTGWGETARLDLTGIVEWIAFGPKGAVAVSGTTMYFAPDGLHFQAAEQGPSKDFPQAGAPSEGDLLPHIAAGGCDGGFGGEGVGPGSIGPVLATPEGFVALTAAHTDDWNNAPICEPLLWFSSDGNLWNLTSNESPFGENAFVSSITDRDGRFVAIGGVGPQAGRVWVSDDGLIWEQAEIDLDLAGTIAAGELGWMLTGVADMSAFSDTQHLWFSHDGHVWDGPYERPEAFRSGYMPPALAVGSDTIFAVGMWDSPVPVIARLSD